MNWKSIIATAFVTGAVTVATGMILFWSQAKAPELTYNSVTSIPFDDKKQTLYIQQVDILNKGNQLAEDVVLSVKFPQGKIQKSKVSIDPVISYKKSEGADFFKMDISTLNPGENAKVSLLIENNNGRVVNSAVSLRANGVKGIALGKSTEKSTPAIVIALLAAYAGIFTFVLSIKTHRERFLFILKGLLSGNLKTATGGQQFDIASILSMHGFPEKAKEYLTSSASRQYWTEADFLAAEAITADKDIKEKTIRVLKDLIEIPNMASFSKSVVAYNISRIYKSLDDNKKVEEYHKIAKSYNEEEIEFRLSKDPIFSTKKI